MTELDVVIAANAIERKIISEQLGRDPKHRNSIAVSVGADLVGFRFRKVYCSDSIRYRTHCSDKHFDEWFNNEVRPRIIVGGEIIVTN